MIMTDIIRKLILEYGGSINLRNELKIQFLLPFSNYSMVKLRKKPTEDSKNVLFRCNPFELNQKIDASN